MGEETDFSPSLCLQGGNDVPADGEPKLPPGRCQCLTRESPADSFTADPESWSLTVVPLPRFHVTPEEKWCDACKPSTCLVASYIQVA